MARSSDFGQDLLAPSGPCHVKAMSITCPSERLRDLSWVTQPGCQEAPVGSRVSGPRVETERWVVRLRPEAGSECAQPGRGMCPSRTALPVSLTCQMPSEPPPHPAAIRYRDGLPLLKACHRPPAPRAPWRTQPVCPGVVAWLPCLPPSPPGGPPLVLAPLASSS